MRVTIRLIISIVVVVVMVASGFSYWQVRQEENRLESELYRRSMLLSESIRENIAMIPAERSMESLSRIVNKFSNRGKLIGAAVFDEKGNPVVVSPALAEKWDLASGKVADFSVHASSHDSIEGQFLKVKRDLIYLYALPVMFQNNPSYSLVLFHQANYINDIKRKIWSENFLTILVYALLISLATLLIVYLNIMAPMRRTTEWIKKVRMGQTSARMNPSEAKLLGPLAKEVSKMAKSLEVARLSAGEEARLRQSSESLWTPERLKEFVKLKLEGRPLFVVSNREPYMHIRNGKNIEYIVPASGLVTAIEPILKACGGTWIAQGSGDADRETADQHGKLKVPPEEPQYLLKRVWVNPEEEKGFYYGFSNEGLWPLCHIAHTRPIFRQEDWTQYESVNEKFAESVLRELEGTTEPCVLIQDYHFALLPKKIKSRRPDARVAIFWHIPWPNPESFGICPWQKELLEGMLGADIIGFHTQFHCNNFMETVDRFLESRIDYEHFTVTREGHATQIKPFPISIAFLGQTGPSSDRGVLELESKEALLKRYGIQTEFLGVGVDRLDYTKGILERFKAIECFIEKNPKYAGKFTFVELGAPSRTLIPKYGEFVSEIEREVERINVRFKARNWKPIHLLMKHHSHKEIAPFYKWAEMCMVTSLHDGMNLVAKEFVTARDDERGVLILSQFTGAARELRDALIVNPYDVGQMAEAIKISLQMPREEQAERMKRMRDVVKDRNIYRWAADLVNELAQLRLEKMV